MKQIKDLKDTLNRYKEKLDKPDLSELLQKHLSDLEKWFNEFVQKMKDKTSALDKGLENANDEIA